MKHPEAQRVFMIIKEHYPESIAKEAAFGKKLPVESSPKERITWAKHLCETLSQLAEEDIKAVRMACRCSFKWENIQEAQKIYRTSHSLGVFAAKARQQLGVKWEATSTSLFVTYTACSCHMVNQDPELLPITWCYCTMGYNKDFFSEVFGTSVDVEMLQAIKLGDQVCLIKVTPQISN